MTAKSLFLQGMKDAIPILVGVAPFGMIYGVLALQAGLSLAAAQGMSLVVFAGSAQFVTVKLIEAGTPWFVIALTAFVINLRHALYSASLAPYLQHLKPHWKGLLAYVLVDEAYALGITRFEQPGSRLQRHWYLLGAGVALWLCWQVSTAAGIFLGAQIPAGWSLDFTLALTFIALVVPSLKDRPMILAAATAGITAVAGYSLPHKLGLILAAAVGIAAGLLSEKLWQKPG
ncbi:MAG TPA: AzlC family ABC transporter permease [Anaerolineaceae bacterium]